MCSKHKFVHYHYIFKYCPVGAGPHRHTDGWNEGFVSQLAYCISEVK